MIDLNKILANAISGDEDARDFFENPAKREFYEEEILDNRDRARDMNQALRRSSYIKL